MSSAQESTSGVAFRGEPQLAPVDGRQQDGRAGMRQELDRMRSLLGMGEQSIDQVLRNRGPTHWIHSSIRARSMLITWRDEGRPPTDGSTFMRTKSSFRIGDVRISDVDANRGRVLILNQKQSEVSLEGWKCIWKAGNQSLSWGFPAGATLMPGEARTFPTASHLQNEPCNKIVINLVNPDGRVMAIHTVESDAQRGAPEVEGDAHRPAYSIE